MVIRVRRKPKHLTQYKSLSNPKSRSPLEFIRAARFWFGFQILPWSGKVLLSRVKPRARPAGTLYKSVTHRPIYGLIGFLLCVARFAPLSAECSFHSPPDKTACYLIVKLLLIPKKNHTVSGYFFFFQVRRLRLQRQNKRPLHESPSIMPGQIAICQIRHTAGWGKPTIFCWL